MPPLVSVSTRGLSSFHIKLMAFGLMFVDHIGRLFFPNLIFMVALGRLSFPLFAWLAAQGERYTSNIQQYVLRLVLLGVVTQPVYAGAIGLIFPPPASLNILFTLAWGVVTIRLARLVEHPILELAIAVILSMVGNLLNVEGGFYSVLTVYWMAKFDRHDWRWWLGFALINLIYVAFSGWNPIALWAILAGLIVAAHNHTQGYKTRWFYLLYPLHFLVLLLVWQLK